MSDEILYVDNTILSSVARCDTQALVRHVWGMTAGNDAPWLHAGQAVHNVLEEWVHRKSFDICMSRLEDYQIWADENVPEKNRLSSKNVVDVMGLWLRRNNIETFPLEILPAPEKNFVWPLDDDGTIMYTGIMDAIAKDRRIGQLFNMDHKTARSIKSDTVRSFEMRSQMCGYAWVLQEMTGQPVLGTYINMIELSKLPEIRYKKDGDAYKCKTHGIGIDKCWGDHLNAQLFLVGITPDKLELWRENAIRIAEKYRTIRAKFTKTFVEYRGDGGADADGALQGNVGERSRWLEGVGVQGLFNGACDWCGFKDWCNADRPREWVETMFEYSPWEPWKGGEDE